MNSNQVSSTQVWWPCVIAMANAIRAESLELGDDVAIIDAIRDQNFPKEHIDSAFEWLHELRSTGAFADAISILAQNIPKDRADHQIEKVFLPNQIWSRLARLRSSGILPVEMVELMVETSRQIDMRDWDEDSINEFFENLVLMLGGSETQSRLISVNHLHKNLLC